ncbi:MAG TPA: MerR family transcriptional regulator [Myxococcota bacterium]|nr:MerR family transcriptional regulator [Myxococcota bacterium]
MSLAEEARYAPAAVAQMTGVSAHALRAWERRYRAVAPERTPGGARRYSEREVARLRLLRRAVDAGHPIGEVASLPDEEIRRRLGLGAPASAPGETTAPAAPLPIEALVDAARTLDVDGLEHTLARLLAALGPRRFARDLATPLLQRIGDEWERGELTVSAEHATTNVVRSLLGTALRNDSFASVGPTVLFATPMGERHELGALVAAIDAIAAGARAVFLGSDLPAAEIAGAAHRLDARAVAIGIAGLGPVEADREVRALRRTLPSHVPILLGGRGAATVAALPGVVPIRRLEELESHVSRIPR